MLHGDSFFQKEFPPLIGCPRRGVFMVEKGVKND
jgi:hypothetical protein